MKIRWTRDSLRLRITPSELDAVSRGEPVQEGLAFPGGLFWNVTLRASSAETALASEAQGVFLSLSQTDRDRLAQPETEGVYFQSDGPRPLRWQVEKDFPCVHPRAAESQETVTETFDAPAGFQQRKDEGDNQWRLTWCAGVPSSNDRDEQNDQEWDVPPTDPRPGPVHTPGTKRAAQQADRDASNAERAAMHIRRHARGRCRRPAPNPLGLGRWAYLGLDRRHVRRLSTVLPLRLRPAAKPPQSGRSTRPHPAHPRLLAGICTWHDLCSRESW